MPRTSPTRRSVLARLTSVLAFAGSGSVVAAGDAPQARAQGATGERKVALVIGNGAYKALTPLANPLNDAAEVATALRAVGFDVTVASNTGLADMTRAVSAFRDKLKGAAVGLFYYSGHGFQTVRVDNHQAVNHIVPVDFAFDAKAKQLPTVPLDTVIDALRTEARVGLVFMDACRDDPTIVAEVKRASQENRNVRFGAGLSSVAATALPVPQVRAGSAPGNGPAGLLVAYSTDPGNVARDGLPGEKLSPFTRALTTHIRTQGLTLSEIMGRVSTDVAKVTKGTQTPWNTSSLTAATYQFSAKPRAPAPPITGISVGAGGITF